MDRSFNSRFQGGNVVELESTVYAGARRSAADVQTSSARASEENLQPVMNETNRSATINEVGEGLDVLVV